MIIKYGINIDNNVIEKRFQNLINQTYKLLPIREQGADWQKALQTIIEELVGIQRILGCGNSKTYFVLLSKMEGLYSLNKEENFSCYRRIIFECLNLMNEIKLSCHQSY